MDTHNNLAARPSHRERIVHFKRVFVVDREGGNILVIDAARLRDTRQKLLCRFQEQLWKLRINPGQHQKAIHGRIDAADQVRMARWKASCKCLMPETDFHATQF